MGKPSAGQALESHFGKDKKDEDEEQGTIDKGKNWSSVNVAYKESKLNFRGSLNTISFTNWLWYRCIRPRLEETKAKLPELSPEEISAYGIDDIEEIFGEFMPVEKEKKDKEDKKEDKDDKKDKKGDKKDKKDEKKKDKKDSKKKKDAVSLNSQEKLQVQNFIKNMIFGESGKGKTTVQGWVNQIAVKDMPVL